MMKTGYKVTLGAIVFVAIAYIVLATSVCPAQAAALAPITGGLGVLAAVAASTIALGNADRRKPKIMAKVTTSIDPESRQKRDGAVSHRIVFSMKNTSGFDLAQPVLSFRLPKDRKHPPTGGTGSTLTFNSNLFNSQQDLRLLEFGDAVVLANRNLPYWNSDEPLDIWIRMRTDDSNPFTVSVSINADGVAGVTRRIKVEPGALTSETAPGEGLTSP